MTEAQHQKTLFDWTRQASVRGRYPELALLFHIPNGGSRDVVEGKHLKQQGVKSGVPDLCLPVARHGYHALYIEMKTEKGRASSHQKWWLDQLSQAGNHTMVCRGWREATEALLWYLEP